MKLRTTVPILRGGNIVSSLGNSFSGTLRETRLTAILGYLISITPESFLELFGIKETALEINLELSEDEGRSDIQIITNKDIIIVEAKTALTDPWKQSLRYKATRRILLTNYTPSKQLIRKNTRYIGWQDIVDQCISLYKHGDYRVKFLAKDLVAYLKEHRMAKKDDVVEIYAREINNESTLSLFLHGRLYRCEYEKGSRITEANYFAPHFGQNIASCHPGVTVGISYIARIDEVDLAESAADTRAILLKHRGKAWLNKNYPLVDYMLQKSDWKNQRRQYLFLGEPRLIFNPSVKKELLQKGSGWLSKRYLTFDELFKAWSGKGIF